MWGGAISAVWTLGTLAWLGVELNIVTIIVPVLILIIGFTYALHVVTDFYAELRGHEGLGSRNAVRKTLETVAVPVLVTGITTGAGFVSLALNRWIPAIQQFGLYSLLGVGFTLLASLTLVPAARCEDRCVARIRGTGIVPGPFRAAPGQS